jgi:hypothetical protein
MPEIETWPPCSPFMNVKSAWTGSPDWSRPTASGLRIWSTKSALTRSSPRAAYTRAPGAGASHSSGSVRSTRISARRTAAPGIVPSTTWRVSDGQVAPSRTPVCSTTIP